MSLLFWPLNQLTVNGWIVLPFILWILWDLAHLLLPLRQPIDDAW
jgi:hypothetical protein